MRLRRLVLRIMLPGLAWLAGCGFPWGFPGAKLVPAYGVEPLYGSPPPAHDHTVQLTDFSYTPASPIHVGDSLTFTAQLNKPTDAGTVVVMIGWPVQFSAGLNDVGAGADAQAGDGVYTGVKQWDQWAGTGEALLVDAQVLWYDGADGQHLQGPPLTVLPEE